MVAGSQRDTPLSIEPFYGLIYMKKAVFYKPQASKNKAFYLNLSMKT